MAYLIARHNIIMSILDSSIGDIRSRVWCYIYMNDGEASLTGSEPHIFLASSSFLCLCG